MLTAKHRASFLKHVTSSTRTYYTRTVVDSNILKFDEHIKAHSGKDPIVYGKAQGFLKHVTSSTRTYYTRTVIDSNILKYDEHIKAHSGKDPTAYGKAQGF